MAGTTRHESSTVSQSHWVNYQTAQNSASNNLGTLAEAQVSVGTTALTDMVNSTLPSAENVILTATIVQPLADNYTAAGVFLGNVNLYPYVTCPQ